MKESKQHITLVIFVQRIVDSIIIVISNIDVDKIL